MNFDPTMLIIFGAIIIVMIVFLVISRKRQKKEFNSYEDMLNSLEPGDKVYLISRLVAYVVCVDTLPNGDKLVTVETGLEDRKSTLTFDIKAIHSVLAKANAASTQKVEEQVEEVKVEEQPQSIEDASENA